ncbi:hypothetical protein CRV24_003962 [Beauveria bassiana]|nr:hypothetical protein CRV24_003962 [Beauveria bassiana]KAF1735044.1 hypothetical protein CRV24_003962 [Beauveria bassiana]
MKATGFTKTEKSEEDINSDSEEASNADADEAAISVDEDNNEEDNEEENNGEEVNGEEDTGEENTGEEDISRNRAETVQEVMPATEYSQMTDQTQLPLEITNTERLLAEHTGRAQGEETPGVNNTQTPPAASASQPAARQAEPITDLPTALTGSTPEAPLLDHSDTVHCPSVSETEREIHVMDTIFLCCLHFNFHLSRYRKQRATTAIRTEVSDIQRQVNDVLRLPYEKAMPEIKKEHTAFYSKKIQAQYMETIFWQSIEEAAKEINPEDCPVPRGPLDGFTRQEKRSHLQFIKDAGYKTGATNARHYRRLWCAGNIDTMTTAQRTTIAFQLVLTWTKSIRCPLGEHLRISGTTNRCAQGLIRIVDGFGQWLVSQLRFALIKHSSKWSRKYSNNNGDRPVRLSLLILMSHISLRPMYHVRQ